MPINLTANVIIFLDERLKITSKKLVLTKEKMVVEWQEDLKEFLIHWKINYIRSVSESKQFRIYKYDFGICIKYQLENFKKIIPKKLFPMWQNCKEDNMLKYKIHNFKQNLGRVTRSVTNTSTCVTNNNSNFNIFVYIRFLFQSHLFVLFYLIQKFHFVVLSLFLNDDFLRPNILGQKGNRSPHLSKTTNKLV